MAKPHRPIPELTAQDISRFWAKVEKRGPNECWFWVGTQPPKRGYFSIQNRRYLSYRITWKIHFGFDPDEKQVCHSCDNGLCCNPSHLWLGTQNENALDMVKKNRCGCITHPERIARGDRCAARKHPERVARGDCHGSKTHPERWAHGERHSQAKLTEISVREIRNLYMKDRMSQCALAKMFSVCQATIGQILRGITWQHTI